MSEAATASRERIDWLLRFLRRDVASMRPGELLDVRDDVLAFCRGPAVPVAAILVDERDREVLNLLDDKFQGEPHEIADRVRDLLVDLQSSALEGADLLDKAKGWVPFQEEAPLPRFRVLDDGTLERTYLAPRLKVGFVAMAADVLFNWWPRLRRCKHEPCGALFLPEHGLQKYHDPRCSKLSRAADYAPKRDYREEYLRRQKRAGRLPTPRWPEERPQCEEKTKDGKRCSRKAALGKTTCKQHSKKGAK